MTHPLFPLLSQTIHRCLHPDARVTRVDELYFPQRGYSGDRIQLFDVHYTTGGVLPGRVPLLVKTAPLFERRAFSLLSRQGHAVIPTNSAASSDPISTN